MSDFTVIDNEENRKLQFFIELRDLLEKYNVEMESTLVHGAWEIKGSTIDIYGDFYAEMGRYLDSEILGEFIEKEKARES